MDQTLLLGCVQRSRPSNQTAAMLPDEVIDQTTLLGFVQRSRPSNQAAAMLPDEVIDQTTLLDEVIDATVANIQSNVGGHHEYR